MACTDKADKTWEKVVAGQKLKMTVTGNKGGFTAAATFFDADGSEEIWTAAELLAGKESKALASPGTHVLIARVIVDPTAPADLKVEVASTLGSASHCHTVTAKDTTKMTHTIRMAALAPAPPQPGGGS